MPPCAVLLPCTLRNVQHVQRGLGMAIGSSRGIEKRWCLLRNGPLLQTHGQTVSYYSHSSLYQNLKDILPTAGLLFAFCTTVVVAVDALHTECGHYVSLNLM